MASTEKETGAAKAAQYKEHKERFRRALNAECYLECVFIDYAMMEDRLLSILHHLNIADRERGNGRGWAKSPAAKRAGYKSALKSLPTIQANGSLPKIDNISTKIEVLRTLATLVESEECCNDFDLWLHTDVRERLIEYNAVELCNRLIDWIGRRNDLVHALFGVRSRAYDAEALENLALEGMELARRLDNISGAMQTLMRRYEKNRVRRAKARAARRS